jgi:RNA-splicing ligase RtcB
MARPSKVRSWAAGRLSPEVARSVDRLASLDTVHAIALMPDVHLAEDVCIGAVVATQTHICPDAVGSDIGLSVRVLDREMGSVWFDGAMANALREEAPSAYKPIGEVMAAQRDLTRITRRLRPVLVYKGT